MAPAGGEGVKSLGTWAVQRAPQAQVGKDHVCTCAHLQVRVSLPCSYEAVTGLSLPKPLGIAPAPLLGVPRWTAGAACFPCPPAAPRNV